MAQKILVVDDDPEVRLALQLRLGHSGYVVLYAVNGAKAIADAAQYAPDLIILDIGMPIVDGWAVLERLRDSKIPIIVLSGIHKHGNRERAMLAGARAFLQKPFDAGLLMATIDYAIGDKS